MIPNEIVNLMYEHPDSQPTGHLPINWPSCKPGTTRQEDDGGGMMIQKWAIKKVEGIVDKET